jgi:hypothetical protein
MNFEHHCSSVLKARIKARGTLTWVCEILRELEAGKTLVSQKHYAEGVLRTGPYSYDTRQPSDKRAM